MENIVERIWPWSRRFSKYSKMFTVKGKNRKFDFIEIKRFCLSEDIFVRVQNRLQLGDEICNTCDGQKTVPRVLLVNVKTADSSVDKRHEGIFIKEETSLGTS